MAGKGIVAPSHGDVLWKSILNYPRNFMLMLKDIAGALKKDFGKEGRANFFKAKRHVNMLLGMAFTLIASYLLFQSFLADVSNLYLKTGLNLLITALGGLLFGMLIDLAQGKGSNGDPRFTAYGAVPGSIIVGVCWYFNYDGWVLPIAGIAIAALAYWLWRPKK